MIDVFVTARQSWENAEDEWHAKTEQHRVGTWEARASVLPDRLAGAHHGPALDGLI